MPDKTTMIDIYEAAGYTINEARTKATGGNMKPFKIELLVIPHSYSWSGNPDIPDTVEFDVLLDDVVTFENSLDGTKAIYHDFTETLKMPVSQVKIVKES